jgi:hypothetical protein
MFSCLLGKKQLVEDNAVLEMRYGMHTALIKLPNHELLVVQRPFLSEAVNVVE